MPVYKQITNGDPEGSVTKVLLALAEGVGAQVICAPFYLSGQEAPVVQVRKVSPDLPPVAFLDPFYHFSTAALLGRIARSSKTLEPMVVILRPCDHRALVELAKLQQIPMSSLTTVVYECPGTVPGKHAPQLDRPARKKLARELVQGYPHEEPSIPVREACRACVLTESSGSDLRVLWRGADPWQEIYWEGESATGSLALESAGLVAGELPDKREGEWKRWREEHLAFREERIQRFRQLYQGPEGLQRALSSCVSCQNCRQVCPLCYCRTCVFDGPDMETSWETVATWLKGRSAVRLPVDTLLYHLVRMSHMAHGCLACGLCGQACPMDVPVDLLFLVGGQIAQEVLGYRPGEKLDEPPPQGTFREEEFQELGE